MSPTAPSAPDDVAARAQPVCVLVGFADALAAPETVWSLRDGGARVLAFTRRGTSPAIRHARGVEIVEITAPELDADAAIADLAALLSGRADVLMPLDDAAVWLCDQVAARIDDPLVAGPTGAPATLALDKREQLTAARAAGFAVPETSAISTEAQPDPGQLPALPLVLKPALAARLDDDRTPMRLRRGGGRVCGRPAELRAALEAWGGREPLLVQPFVSGSGEGLFGIAGESGVRALSAHRRLRMADPQGSGSSACESIPVDPALAAAAQRMLSAIGWRGLFMLEFLRDADDVPWFMELNGRTWGSMALARRQGLEYPAWALAEATDPSIDATGGLGLIARGAPGLVCRHLGRELLYLIRVMRGPRSVALTAWPSRRRALRDVLRVRRDERWYNWRAAEWRVLAADTVQSVLAPWRRAR